MHSLPVRLAAGGPYLSLLSWKDGRSQPPRMEGCGDPGRDTSPHPPWSLALRGGSHQGPLHRGPSGLLLAPFRGWPLGRDRRPLSPGPCGGGGPVPDRGRARAPASASRPSVPQASASAALAGTPSRGPATSTSPRGGAGRRRRPSAGCSARTWPASARPRSRTSSTVGWGGAGGARRPPSSLTH